MGFIQGSASFVRFTVEGQLPDSAMNYIAERVSAFSFKDIDESYDEYSIGWVSVVNMFDSRFAYASYSAGDNIVLSLRIDERKVSPAVLKKMVMKEEERVRLEKQIPRLGRSLKVEIKERVRTELIRKSLPVPVVYDLYWNLTDNTLLFFTTNRKAHAILEDFFKETFGLLLRQQIPYLTAEHLLDEPSAERLAMVMPEILM